jgi:hypothetical protein
MHYMQDRSPKHNTLAGPMFSDEQLFIIADAVEDFAVLAPEHIADDCDEIVTIIEAHFHNKNNVH